jgi:UDP-3-O-[3-hydroxymyristoyl] glucosamine N-acyltransferase
MHTVEDIARALGGRVIGNGGALVSTVSPIDDARAGTVVFVKSRGNFAFVEGKRGPLCVVAAFEPPPERAADAGGQRAGGQEPGGPGPGGPGPGGPYDFVVIPGEETDMAFIRLLSLFEKKDRFHVSVSAKASISPSAVIGDGVRIGDFVAVGDGTVVGDGTDVGSHVSIGRDCSIGKSCTIYPNVTIYPDTVIGDGVTLHAGAVIGSDGFGYSNIGGVYHKIPQIGGVRIERNVEIGANTTVDRATIGYTVIGENTKVDNLVQIAHNVVIGKNTVICGLCGISGSVKIGDNVIVAGAVGIADHVVIEDGVYLGAKSGVMEKVVTKGRRLLGTPAIGFKTEMEFIALKPKIKAMFFDLKKIKEKLGL